MSDTNRTIEELVDDYAGALRDGCIPTFLKSLTREEGKMIASSDKFRNATKTIRILNGFAFASKARTCSISQFISRVDNEIGTRLTKTKAFSKSSYGTYNTSTTKTKNKAEKKI